MAQIVRKLYLPALKGAFGQWFFYSALMPVTELAGRVSFAEELHKSKELSKLIQRELSSKRAREIATYIHRERERFFNSLVIAVYGGHPQWHPARIISKDGDVNVEEIPDKARQSVGLLCLDGTEKLFAVDGQHRLAGVKEAIRNARESSSPESWGDKFLSDEVSVVFIGHEQSKSGLERTRRVFTTLNKTAKAVTKGQTIALDENDAMAIISRHLVEEHSYFSDGRVAIRAKNNLSPKDVSSFTTIGALYDVLTILFSKLVANKKSVNELRFGNRPTPDELDEYYKFAVKFFRWLANEIPELREYFDSSNPRKVIAKYRGEFGGHLVFRPIGLLVITAVVARISQEATLRSAIRAVSQLPMMLAESPLKDVLWRASTRTIQAGKRAFMVKVYLAEMGYLGKRQRDKISEQYQTLTGNPL